MELSEAPIIHSRRLELGLTQEQVASTLTMNLRAYQRCKLVFTIWCNGYNTQTQELFLLYSFAYCCHCFTIMLYWCRKNSERCQERRFDNEQDPFL